MTFGFFLFALYVIAAGLAFLETAANPLYYRDGARGKCGAATKSRAEL